MAGDLAFFQISHFDLVEIILREFFAFRINIHLKKFRGVEAKALGFQCDGSAGYRRYDRFCVDFMILRSSVAAR